MYFLRLYIKLVSDKRTWIDTCGDRSIFKIYNIHCCTPILLNRGGNEDDDEESTMY